MHLLNPKKIQPKISAIILFSLLVSTISPLLNLSLLNTASATSKTSGLNVAPVITTSTNLQVDKATTAIGNIEVTDDDNVVMQFGTDTVTGNEWKTQSHAQMCNPVVVTSSRNDVDTNKQTVVRATNKTSTGFDIKVDNQNQDIPIAQSTDVDWVVMNEGTYDLIDDNANTFHVSADSIETTTIFGNACRPTITTTNVAFSPNFSADPSVIHSISSDNDTLSIASTVNGADGDYRSDPTSSNMGLFMQVGHGSCIHDPEDVDYIAMDQGHYTFGGVEVDSVKSGVIVKSVTATGDDVDFFSPFPTAPQTILTSMLGVNGPNGGYANVHSAGTVTATSFPATIDEDGNTARSHTTEPVGALAFQTDSGVITQPNTFAYSLTGGDDASKFQISSSGALSFVVGQDGDNPTDTDSDGIYDVEVQVCDSHCDTKCTSKTFSVEVDKKPVITLTGDSVMSLVQGESYSEQGATCLDSFDGTCTSTSTGVVDTTRVGTYTIHYNATDSSGNAADSISRTINITPAPILINEVEYDTAGEEAESEWFEIYNPTSGIVNIENWTVTEKVGSSNSKTYTFEDIDIPAGGYIVITNQTADFQDLYPGITPDIDLPGTAYFALKNSPSDELILKDLNGTEIDYVAWENTAAGWNIAGTDASICRLSVPDTDTVADWTSGCSQTPQAQNQFNFKPTDIILTSDSIAENNSGGYTIATLSSTDLDLTDSHTYTLVSGIGSDDNASFSISGSDLIITPVTDYETQSSYAIRIATNDGKGGIYEEEITISITDENLAPTTLSLSNNTIDENNSVGELIGALNGTDDGEDTNTLTYALSCTTPGVDDSNFSISGANLNAGNIYDYETKSVYNICVQISDGVLTYDENFVININDLDEIAPVITITAPTKLQNSVITDSTITVTDNVGINASDVSATGGTISCTQTSAVQVDCTSNIPASGNLVVTALDTSTNSGTATENNYVVDEIAPTIPNVSVDTSSPFSLEGPEVTFSSLDNVAIDHYTITYYLDDGNTGTGTLTTISPVTSPIILDLDPDEIVHTIVVTAYDTAGNSSASTIKFPPIVTINAPTTLSSNPITDSTVTITSPPGNKLTNIMLVTSTTGASLGSCIGNGGETSQPYGTPVVCNIDGISDSGSISILAEDAGNGAEGLNSQSYIIDTTPPVITITAPTKLDNASITDTTISIIDDTAITATNVVVDVTSTTTTSIYVCTQINPSQVNCTISIDTSGDLVISATDNAGNNDLENENTYIIDKLPPVLSLVGNNPETVEYLASYSDAGADFIDNIDGTGSVVGIGNVNTGILGTYAVDYNYSDVAGNSATQISRVVEVVDTTLPVITLVGNAIETVEVNTTYTDVGSTALDNYDGDLTTSIVATDDLDLSIVGSYLVTYNVVDSNGNIGLPVTRTVNVVDTTPPVISLTGSDEIVLEVGDSYSELGATSTDNYEAFTPGDITIDSTGVNTSVIGNYIVTYNLTDSSGNVAEEITRAITVLDTTIPVITILGNNPETVEVNSLYSHAGATALDNYDGNISTNIISTDDVDTSTLGSYGVKYNVIDSSSNKAVEVTRIVNVVDTTIPVVTLNGSDTITQEVGENFSYIGAVFSDNIDGTGNVSASGSVDTNTVGTYILTYDYIDSSLNSAIQVTRTVNIVDTTPPVISLNGLNLVTVVVGYPYVEQGAICLDNYDASCSVSASGTVDTSVIGSTIITYSAIDAAGNDSSITRTVITVTGDSPVILINGSDTITQEVGSLYSDAGAEYSDTEDGTGSVIGTGTVDTNTLGAYTINYTHTDISGNVPEDASTRTVNIVDTTIPVITLNGSGSITQEVGSTYSDLGAVANDNYDGTSNVAAVGTVDTNTLGSYTQTYNFSDTSGNAATQLTRTVNIVDTTIPVISLVGDSTITLFKNGTYSEQGATCSDNYDTTCTPVITGSVDSSTIGTYSLYYNATDANSNVATQIVRTVNIISGDTPIISIIGDAAITQEVGSNYTDLGASFSDTEDGTGSIVGVGTVDNNSVGIYTKIYNYTDFSSNVATQVTRTVNIVDTTIPVINLTGSGFITQEFGSVYSDLGAVATDNVDGTINLVASGSVDVNSVGTYILTYDYTDVNLNKAIPVTRTVNIVDTTPPVVSLIGNSPESIFVNGSFTDSGASWEDIVDGSGNILTATSGTVDNTTPGIYSLNYSYTDTSGNTHSISRIVNVVAGETPIINVVGDSVITQEVGTSYSDEGAEFSDIEDGTGSLVGVGMVDTNTVGAYEITYNYTDFSGNDAVEITRTVNIVDTTIPVISLVGDSTITLFKNTSYSEQGATCSDNYDTTCTPVITGSVDSSTIGTYSLYYNATDANSNVATQIVRTVNIISGDTPVISIIGDSSITQEVGTSYSDEGAEFSDTEDGTGSVVGVETVDTNTVGAYEITYNYTDASGNDAAEVTRTVNIVDTTPAVITLLGNNPEIIFVNKVFTDSGASWIDNVDGSGIIDSATSGSVDTSITGTYNLVYSYTDTFGNRQSVKRVVKVSGGVSSSGPVKKADVCNDTGGDFSGNYYDGVCEATDELIPEPNIVEDIGLQENTIENQINTSDDYTDEDSEFITEITDTIDKENTDGDLSTVIESESRENVGSSQENNGEKNMQKEINSKVVEYTLKNTYEYCPVIDNLLNDNYTNGFSSKLIDIDNSNYKSLIENLEKSGVITGTDENRFEGNRDISRVEFLKFVLRSHCIEYRDEDPSDLIFSDLDNTTWQAKVVKKSFALGIANGDIDQSGNKIFRADDIISTIEATKILMRMALVQKLSEPDSLYDDLDVEWHMNYVTQGEQLGIFNAQSDNYKFNPENGIDRNSSVEFLYKVVRLYR